MIKEIRFWIIKIVGVSKGEANALLILVPILLLIIVLPPFFRSHFTGTYSNHVFDQIVMDSLLEQIKINQAHNKDINANKLPISHKKFNPNTASIALLEANGISTNIAKRIINYRTKGGKFKKKEDLQKIYGIDAPLYKLLIPYIAINTTVPSTPKTYKDNLPEKTKISSFDINTADTATLKQIYGIGNKLSMRIVKYRDKLGGYINTKQLSQVYGLQTEVVDSLLSYGSISDNFTPSLININSDTIKHLSQHPYIDYRLAKAIVNYRRQHGNYHEIAQIKNIHLMNDSIYHVMAPYLKVSK